jgi:hypothetical protein
MSTADTPAPAVPLDGPQLVAALRDDAAHYECDRDEWSCVVAASYRALADKIEAGLLADAALLDRAQEHVRTHPNGLALTLSYSAKATDAPRYWACSAYGFLCPGDSVRDALSGALPEAGV